MREVYSIIIYEKMPVRRSNIDMPMLDGLTVNSVSRGQSARALKDGGKNAVAVRGSVKNDKYRRRQVRRQSLHQLH
jgi:hypothetical protein